LSVPEGVKVASHHAELSQAVQDVANGERIVAEQQERIDRLKNLGSSDVSRAEDSLRLFVRLLEAFRSHEQLLRREITDEERQ
jgi:hypothetical protein